MATGRGASLPVRAAERVVRRLIDEKNELALDPGVLADVRRQVETVARAVLKVPTASSRRSHEADRRLGMRRAASNIHPASSLRAATICFEEILPLLLASEPGGDAHRVLKQAVALQEVLGEVVFDAATGYVDHLLARLHNVHLQERQIVASQLHDRTAQSIASALQRLEYDTIPTEDVRQILQEALEEVRSVALDLRQFVGSRRLDEALKDYAEDRSTHQTRVELRQTGEPRFLPAVRQEEAFVIIRELIINALKHSRATVVAVSIEWRDSDVQVTVRDDGIGFNPAGTHRARMGLLICRERADSIDAVLSVETAPHEGTTAALVVPF